MKEKDCNNAINPLSVNFSEKSDLPLTSKLTHCILFLNNNEQFYLSNSKCCFCIRRVHNIILYVAITTEFAITLFWEWIVQLYIYIYIYIYTHTHTVTLYFIYKYIYVCIHRISFNNKGKKLAKELQTIKKRHYNFRFNNHHLPFGSAVPLKP